MKLKSLIYGLFGAILFLASCSEAPKTPATSDNEAAESKNVGQAFIKDELSANNILQVAIGSKDHTTLVAAVQAAQLENVLVNAGPLTVFAPTNDAFAKLPAGTVENLVKPENQATLSKIIKYHASPGNYQVDMLNNNQSLFQASGHYIKITKDGDNLKIGDANIIGTVQASNGVIHVIDAVLLPPDL